ncbi:MAG: hypothetical protein WDN75_06650 [Bacteroidota bacterium]
MDIAIISPVFLMLDKKIRHDWRDIASLFLVAHAVDNSIYFATQFSVRRARPLTYNPAVPLEEKMVKEKAALFSAATHRGQLPQLSCSPRSIPITTRSKASKDY